MKNIILVIVLFVAIGNHLCSQVGIGTKNPLSKLHVNGQLRVDTILSGTISDSILTVASNGVIKRLNSSSFLSNIFNTDGVVSTNRVIDLNGKTISFTNVTGNFGIGTQSPRARLDIRTSPSSTSDPGAGFLGIGTTSTAASIAGAGAIRYSTASGGVLEYSNGATWNTLSSIAIIGDIKTGIQSTDHNGWIQLDGRAKSTLTATQQTQATALGIGTNLPNATNTYLSQNGAALGTVTGSNTKTIAQDQLPNINYSGDFVTYFGNSSPSGVLSATNGNFKSGLANGSGYSVATVNFNLRLNGNVTQQALDITPRSLSVNTFIYLGN